MPIIPEPVPVTAQDLETMETIAAAAHRLSTTTGLKLREATDLLADSFRLVMAEKYPLPDPPVATLSPEQTLSRAQQAMFDRLLEKLEVAEKSLQRHRTSHELIADTLKWPRGSTTQIDKICERIRWILDHTDEFPS